MGRPTDFTSELASIYGLYDASGALRYIGKARKPAERLKGHMRDSRNRNTPLYCWIRKHGLPEMRILEADCADWKEAERRLIAEARDRGDRLLNVADGGDEPYCPTAVRAANGAANAKAIHSDPVRKRVWGLKREMAMALKQGHVRNSTREKLRKLAAVDPKQFGMWAGLKDRAEDAHGAAIQSNP